MVRVLFVCTLYMYEGADEHLVFFRPVSIARVTFCMYIYRYVLHLCAARQSHLNPTPPPRGGTYNTNRRCDHAPARLPARPHACSRPSMYTNPTTHPPIHTYTSTYKPTKRDAVIHTLLKRFADLPTQLIKRPHPSHLIPYPRIQPLRARRCRWTRPRPLIGHGFDSRGSFQDGPRVSGRKCGVRGVD